MAQWTVTETAQTQTLRDNTFDYITANLSNPDNLICYRPYGYRGSIIYPIKQQRPGSLIDLGARGQVLSPSFSRITFLTGQVVGDINKAGFFYLVYNLPTQEQFLNDRQRSEPPVKPTDVTWLRWEVSFGCRFTSSDTTSWSGPGWTHLAGSGFYTKPLPLECLPVSESLHVYLNGIEQFENTDYDVVTTAQGTFEVVPKEAMDVRSGDLLESYYACQGS